MMNLKLLFPLLCLSLMMSCKASKLAQKKTQDLGDFPYQMEADAVYQLDSELNEISGLSLYKDDRYLLAVQDEDGIVFHLDKQSGAIINKSNFKKAGDYEGLCYKDDKCFVLKSSGTIYEMDLQAEELIIKKHKGLLNKKMDHEGITFDQVSNKFLVCCKDSEGLEPENNNNRFIYALDLQSNTKEDFFRLNRREIMEHLRNTCTSEEIDETHKKIFDEDRDYLHAGPSGICIHPLNGLVYVLSSKGKYLFICTRNGKIKEMIKLDKRVLPQPEGIVIDHDGTMYIASESSDKSKAVLSVYKMKVQ